MLDVETMSQTLILSFFKGDIMNYVTLSFGLLPSACVYERACVLG